MSKVFLITPTKPEAPFSTPHLGSAMLSAALKERGHEVRVFDYSTLRRRDRKWENLQAKLETFRPDLVGVSVCTASVSIAMNIAKKSRDLLGVPIVAGGPHVTLNPDKMIARECVDTVVAGDGEVVLPNIADDPNAYSGQVVTGGQIDVNAVPRADFSDFFGCERMCAYPLMTSRGCPFNCSFCTVHTVTSRRWRHRSLDDVFAELDAAREKHPKLKRLEVHDDCPTTNVKRFKTFLRGLIDRRLKLELRVANIRADTVDEELVELLMEAGSKHICIAAEHGNPEVYNFIGKAEKMEEIERAGRIIKKHGAQLSLCMVIGLPKDNLDRIRDSISLAKRLKPTIIFWNMVHPFRHTRIRQWYEENGGIILDDDDHSSYREPSLTCDDPIVWTPDFTAEQRRQAKFLCVIETDQWHLRRDSPWKLFSIARRYGYTWPAAKSLFRKLTLTNY